MTKNTIYVFGALLLAFAALHAAEGQSPRPNTVIIFIDDVKHSP